MKRGDVTVLIAHALHSDNFHMYKGEIFLHRKSTFSRQNILKQQIYLAYYCIFEYLNVIGYYITDFKSTDSSDEEEFYQEKSIEVIKLTLP